MRDLLVAALRRRRVPPGRQPPLWLDELRITDEQWAAFGIPIGLAFFMISSVTGSVIALYPSPAGATESELDLARGRAAVRGQPGAGARARHRGADRQPLGDAPQQVIVPIDAAYGLVGVVKAAWEGITGGAGVPGGGLGGTSRTLRARPAVGA